MTPRVVVHARFAAIHACADTTHIVTRTVTQLQHAETCHVHIPHPSPPHLLLLHLPRLLLLLPLSPLLLSPQRLPLGLALQLISVQSIETLHFGLVTSGIGGGFRGEVGWTVVAELRELSCACER